MIGQFEKFSIQYKIDALRNNEKHGQAAKLQTTTSCHRSTENTYQHYTATMRGTFFGCTMQEVLTVLLITHSLASIKHK